MITRWWPRKPTSSICARRALRSPSTSPTLASGAVTSTFMIGSSRRVPASREAWRSASPTAAFCPAGVEASGRYSMPVIDDLDVLDGIALRARAHRLARAFHAPRRGWPAASRGSSARRASARAADDGQPDHVAGCRAGAAPRARGRGRTASRPRRALEARLGLGRLGQGLAVARPAAGRRWPRRRTRGAGGRP